MKPIRSAAGSALLLSLSLLAVPAWADDDCEAPVAQWQSRDAVLQMAARQGWQVQRLKIDDGCYELRGRDAQGRDFKAKIDPRTLAIVKLKARGDDHDQRRERQRQRGAEPAPRSATPADAPPPGGSTGRIE